MEGQGWGRGREGGRLRLGGVSDGGGYHFVGSRGRRGGKMGDVEGKDGKGERRERGADADAAGRWTGMVDGDGVVWPSARDGCGKKMTVCGKIFLSLKAMHTWQTVGRNWVLAFGVTGEARVSVVTGD